MKYEKSPALPARPPAISTIQTYRSRSALFSSNPKSCCAIKPIGTNIHFRVVRSTVEAVGHWKHLISMMRAKFTRIFATWAIFLTKNNSTGDRTTSRPKKPISERALTTDFKGDWYTGYDALDSLKDVLGQLTTSHAPWWSLRSPRSLEQLQYPVTSSADEWADEVLHLDQLLGEGFEAKWLRKRAESVGRTPDIKFASIKLLEEVVIGLGFEPPDAAELIAPFREARELRSKVKGHAAGTEASEIKRQILKHYHSYQAHFRALCQRCDEAIRTLDRALK